MNSIKSVVLKILISMVLILLIPFLFAVGIIYFLTKVIKLVELRMERV